MAGKNQRPTGCENLVVTLRHSVDTWEWVFSYVARATLFETYICKNGLAMAEAEECESGAGSTCLLTNSLGKRWIVIPLFCK
ncbi:hypothetical protein FRC02_005019 [Tulasnella sp. 418]|nr:hypothetical protein FRC02_005019 [Tulasnella sp. 418]